MKPALIIEDDASIRKIIKSFLEHTNKFSEIHDVESAEDAIEIFEKDKYSLLVIDVRLIHMTGVDLCILCREIDEEVYIIGITGYSILVEEGDLGLAGFNACFAKPFGYKEFFDHIVALDV